MMVFGNVSDCYTKTIFLRPATHESLVTSH
jgi:hypothetical protein